MFEARLNQGSLFKRIIEAIKDLVVDVNLDCNSSGITIQAMDSSHVSLITLLLRKDGFDLYRCDRNITLGIHLPSLTKILKCSGNKDTLSISCDDNADTLNIMFEDENSEKISEFELKLMEIESEHLSIPDIKYSAVVKMSSSEFQNICRDLLLMGDTVNISCTKEGIRFAVSGDIGKGSTTLRPTTSADKPLEESTVIDIEGPVDLSFALKYLNHFTKATPLSNGVVLSMSSDVPIVVEYRVETFGYLRFFLAPKIDEGAGDN